MLSIADLQQHVLLISCLKEKVEEKTHKEDVGVRMHTHIFYTHVHQWALLFI